MKQQCKAFISIAWGLINLPGCSPQARVPAKQAQIVRLSLSAESASHSAVFFSHNKSANSTFSHDLSAITDAKAFFINSCSKMDTALPSPILLDSSSIFVLFLICMDVFVSSRVTEYHIDGFRFDLASVLCRGPDGSPLDAPPLIKVLAPPLIKVLAISSLR